MATKTHEISDLKYHLISEWMELNGFVVSKDDDYMFIKEEDNLKVAIVSNGQGDHSFMILFLENEKEMSSFTGDLNLPTLLGYLLWHSLLTNYRITK